MTVENTVLENMKNLPAEKQREVLDFSEFLLQKEISPKPRRSLKGALAHLNVRVSDEEIRASRGEMWRGYMKEDFE